MARQITVRGNFKPSRAAERRFYKALEAVAKVSGRIVEKHIGPRATLLEKERMQKELERYAEKITPWATSQSMKLLQTVQRSNKRAWEAKSKAIGKALDLGVASKDVGDTALHLLFEQVSLIKSIPIEAGLRAQQIAYEAVLTGTRAAPNEDTIKELEKELGASTAVATSRAQLIAITETARATASINQARAVAVGSNSYRWHNSGDGAVRESHKIYRGKRLQGMKFEWDKPPTLSDGMTGHPGTFPRCRCFAEPVFNEE